MRTGYISDLDDSTRKVEILAETTDGRFVCRRGTSEMKIRWDGSKYLSQNFGPLFLKPKNEVEVEDE